MLLKYYHDDTYHHITAFEDVGSRRVRVYGENLPQKESGFTIYETENIELYLCKDYNGIYEVTDEYIEFTSDPSIYNVFYIYDPETMYVVSMLSCTLDKLENGVLVASGRSKDIIHYVPSPSLHTEEGVPNYKAARYVDDELDILYTSDEEKEQYLKELIEKNYQQSKRDKVAELSDACSAMIEEGITYNNLRYSYTLEDQNNLSTAVELSKVTGMAIPYHANNESCQLYDKEEIVKVYVLNQTNLTHHVTYFNQLKLFTDTLSTQQEVEAVQYGQALEGQYLVKYMEMMEQSKKIIAAYLGIDAAEVDAMLQVSSLCSL